MTDDLTPDLTRTVALLGDGYRIDTLARAKRAQERNEMLTADTISQAAVIRRDREAAIHLARAIVRDAERLARTVAEHDGEAGLSINIHDDDLARAALDLPDAWRNDFQSRNRNDELVPHTSVTVGPVQFFAAVRL